MRFLPKLLAAVLLIGLVTLGISSCAPRGSKVEQGTALLLDAFAKRRFIEPRLSGGFKCGAFGSSPDEAPGINTAKLDKARSLILDAVDGGDPSSQLAYARLLLSEGKKLPDALRYLHRVLAASDSAEAHNDLGVCLIQQSKLEDAIDEFKVALKLKPDMPEAVFNTGLCYQRLLLSDAATAEYDRLLALESDRGWMEEINQRRQKVSRDLPPQKTDAEIIAPLDAAIEAGNLDEARAIAAEQFESLVVPASFALPIRYLTDSKDGTLDQADRTLSEIELIGEEFERAMGDSSVTDLARYLSNLPASEKPLELALISDYLDATEVFPTRQYKEGQPKFARLYGLFKKRGNAVFECLSINDLANCLSSAGSLKAGLDALQSSIARFEQYRWPFRHAMLTTTLGLTYSRLGEDSKAISACNRALDLYRNAPRGRAKVQQIMGLACRHVGDLETGLRSLRESTGLFLAGPTDWAELAFSYLSSSDFQRLRGNHSLALLYAEEAIKFSRLSKSPSRSAQALSVAALEQARLDQLEQSQALLDAAFESVTRTPQSQRNSTEQLVLTRAAELAARRGDITRSVEYYTKAEALLTAVEGREIPLINVLRGRGEAYFAGGEFDKAGADLSRAIDLIESYRSQITDAKNRSDYLDATHSVFDRLISLNVRGFARRAEAFRLSEQSRARTLLDELSLHDPKQRGETGERGPGVTRLHKPVRPLGLADVQRSLPADFTLVSYSVTDQGTFAFIVTHSSLEIVELTATAEALDRLVNNYVSDLQSLAPLDEVTNKARELYGYLIEPLRSQLGGSKRLCIVPDKALHFLPFAALVDRDGRYLVESYWLSSVPSASALVQCLRESGEKHTIGDAKILAVGNPDFDRDAFPLLADLPESEREAKLSAAFYGSNKVVLTGADATERRLRAELEDCDVAHLAVHCLVEANSPSLAALVLAPNRERGGDLVRGNQPSAEDGLLSLNEISGMSLPKTKLVVLSACQSGLGRYYRGEGIVSLVRPFLALRVPTVVASLWSVDSQSTASLMIEFQKQIRTANAGPSEALRFSQIKMAGSEEHKHPYYWAPFTVIGSAY